MRPRTINARAESMRKSAGVLASEGRRQSLRPPIKTPTKRYTIPYFNANAYAYVFSPT